MAETLLMGAGYDREGRAARSGAVLRLAFVPMAVDIDMVQLPPMFASLFYPVRPERLAA